jgi:hypothetical protein
MNASNGLVKSYKIDDAAGVGQYVVVVQGANDGCCKKPAAANAKGFVGVTLEAQANQNKGVAVQKTGIARAVANGAITRGDRLQIASNAGDVKSVEASIPAAGIGGAATYEVVGRAEVSAANGDVFSFFIQPETVCVAVS